MKRGQAIHRRVLDYAYVDVDTLSRDFHISAQGYGEAQVEETISVRWSAMRLARSSWTKRTMPLSSSMHTMVADVVMLRLKLDANTTSVINERMASTDRMTVKGLMNALLNR